MIKLLKYFKKIKKGWGHELVIHNTSRLCVKFLNFNKGAKASLHFHADKEEIFYVLSGEFIVTGVDTNTGYSFDTNVKQGDFIYVPVLSPHKIACIKEGIILESSTHDKETDSYRVLPGNSQNL